MKKGCWLDKAFDKIVEHNLDRWTYLIVIIVVILWGIKNAFD